MNLTQQQQAIVNHIADMTNDEHFVVGARAGTGKTSTIVEGANRYAGPGIAVAFNKPIQLVLEARLPSTFAAKTINGVGYGAYIKATNLRPSEIDKKKPLKLQRELGLLDSFPDLRRAIDVAREWGISPTGAPADPESILPDTPQTWNRLFDEFTIDTGDYSDPIGACREALLRAIKEAWRGHIDFVDQKYMTAIYNWRVPRFPLVLVDEAQDLSPIDRRIAEMMIEPGGRIGAVGDEFQAIYGFRGADRKSISNIVEHFKAKVLPMTMSFRCPRAVIRQAQLYVPDIECGSEVEGSVHQLDKLQLTDVPTQAAFLCRNTKPLIALYFRLIREGIPAAVRGRDIGASISKLIRDTRKPPNAQIREALQVMWNRVGQQVASLESRDMSESAALLSDKAECVQIIAERVGLDRPIFEFQSEIDRLFTDEVGSGVLLSTVHKAKGLEWRDVYILDPYLMPSKYAKTPEALAQEKNLQYVAVTRSQLNLSYINSERIV